MKKLIFLLTALFAFSILAQAQTSEPLTDKGTEKVDENAQIELPEEEDTTTNMWSDPLYYQFEKMMPQLARSLGRLESRISTIAVTEISFSSNLDRGFKKVATAKIYGQLLLENPRLRLIKCNECNMLRSEIKNGILNISRGLADQESRAALADKLGVQAFMTSMVVEDERQLSIVVNIYDAKDGRIILSDVIPGVPAPKSTYWNWYAGQMKLPVTLSDGSSLDHTALMLGVEKTIRFSESWLLSANFALYTDNNSKLADGHVTFTPGMLFDGTVGWEALSMNNNNISFSLVGGMGEFVSTQFNFSVYQKVGLKVIIGQLLTFNYYSLSFDETNLEAASGSTEPAKLPGSGSTLSFGFQF